MTTTPSFIADELGRLGAAGLLREARRVDGPIGTRVTMDGEEKLLFCSNDYLGLAAREEGREAAAEAAHLLGAGAGASRLVSGTMALHEELEERIRAFKGAEAVLLFNSGYAANLGVITAIAGRGTEIFSDRLNHASIVDAAILSRARVRRYAHGDAAALEKLLKASAAARKLIITEGVFSMDGDMAPIAEIAELLERYDALLYLDDAHGFGTLGPTGRGTMEALGMEANPRIIEMATLGKAFGSFGAFVACSPELKALLTTKARAFVYTTALPPGVCAASAKALEIVEKEPALVARLQKNAAKMRTALGEKGLPVMKGETQIIPLVVGSTGLVMRLSAELLGRGLFIQGIRPPTVPEGSARLRLTVSAAHTDKDMDRAVEVLGRTFSALGPLPSKSGEGQEQGTGKTVKI